MMRSGAGQNRTRLPRRRMWSFPTILTLLLALAPLPANAQGQVAPPLPTYVHMDSEGFVVYDYVKPLPNSHILLVQGQRLSGGVCKYKVTGPRIYPGQPGVAFQGIADKEATCQMRVEMGSIPAGFEGTSTTSTAAASTLATSSTSCPNTTSGYPIYNCAHAFAAYSDCCIGNVTSVTSQIQWWGGDGQINGIGYDASFHKDDASGWAESPGTVGYTGSTNGSNWAETKGQAVYTNDIFCAYSGTVWNYYDYVDIDAWQDGSINGSFYFYKYGGVCNTWLSPKSDYNYGWN